MAQNPSKLMNLATQVYQSISEIDKHLAESGQAGPSFAADANFDWKLPPHIVKHQTRVLEACTELEALVEGPRLYLIKVMSPRMNIMASLHAIYQYKIAAAFAAHESVSYNELAKRTGLDLGQLTRLLRMAITHHIFQESEKGMIQHSAISRAFVDDQDVSQWLGLVCEEHWPLGPKTLSALSKWPGSGDPNESVFALANSGNFWDVLNADIPRAQRFADGIRFLQSHPTFDLEFLFKSLDWDDDACPDILVDIGGSQGSICKALLRRYPRLGKCFVQDVPEVLQGAAAPDDLYERLYFSPHNFFTEQPIKNADVYFLRSILHDWSDQYSLKIIRNLTPALKPGARIILNEVCLPEPNTLPYYHEQLLRGYDLAMMQAFNSKERDADDWKVLFEKADSRFKLDRIQSQPGSILSVIEIVWCPES